MKFLTNEYNDYRKRVIVQFGLMLVYKVLMEYSYITYLNRTEPKVYGVEFNVVKYIYGLFWLIVLFFLINHREQRASSFMLHFFYVMQIVPLVIIYEMQNENTIFFTIICISVAICEILVRYAKLIKIKVPFFIHHIFVRRLIIGFIVSVVIAFLIIIYHRNGLPTLIALNIYDVYELRRSGIYNITKYLGYVQDTIIKVFIPILLTKFLIDRKWMLVILVYAYEVIIYLYVGEKSFLFSGVMVIGTVLWTNRKYFSRIFWNCFYIVVSMICILANSTVGEGLYSLFIRRIFFLSANNKFIYHDFFSVNPKEGFAGVFPRWLIPLTSHYGYGYPDGYTYQIGSIYYNSPKMDCNTGFLAEGFLRWGYLGIIIELILFAYVLRLIDRLQVKTSYVFAIGVSINVIFGLGDSQLISPILCGYLTVWVLFLLFYKEHIIRKVDRAVFNKWP